MLLLSSPNLLLRKIRFFLLSNCYFDYLLNFLLLKEAIVSFLNNLLTSKTGFSIFYELKVFTVLNSPLEF